MAWIRHRRLGIVTTSPKHFGTGLTIQCSIRAPHLAIHPKFERILSLRSLELVAISDDIVNLETIHTLGRSESVTASDLVYIIWIYYVNILDIFCMVCLYSGKCVDRIMANGKGVGEE